ncbi:MAG: hypothetical protein LQ343_007139 [Gyalolechia ehrenbergii]|nr:MAG: hypothetical protein LQ343_007139 [Gyalolechia ehrenbergii]
MLAARDQENFIHGHQAAAAAKPLNQGTKQALPKTPGNKTAKTPLRVPLNDENGPTAFGGGKKTGGNGTENAILGGKQGGRGDVKAFVTLMGPRTRAPLGAKTTNAKAKAFQTPAAAPIGNDLGKMNQKTVSTRKPKPKVSYPETTKLQDILADKEALDEREIEYMPPRPKDLPDHPDDDLPELDFSVLQGSKPLAGWFEYLANKPDAEGLSYRQRKEIEERETNEYLDKKGEAESLLAADSAPLSCLCDIECWGDECKQSIARRKEAQKTYKKTMAALESKYLSKAKVPERKGPNHTTSKAAATALSNPKRSTTNRSRTIKPSAPAKKPASVLPQGKKMPAPTKSSEMRHAAATVASKTTIGYSRGRVASTGIRESVLPGKEKQHVAIVPNYSLAPALFIEKYGVPRYGSEKWLECRLAGCFDEEKKDPDADLGDTVSAENDALAKYFQEEAEKEFVLEF